MDKIDLSVPEGLEATAITNLLGILGSEAPAVLPSLVNTFIEESRRLLESARHAIQEADPPALRLASHSMKSNCATFGAQSLANLCLQLEMQAKEGNLEGTKTILAQIEAEYDRILPSIQDLVGSLFEPGRGENGYHAR